jgi:hypothetical protein
LLTVVHDPESANDSAGGRLLLDEIVRDGARQMLAAALRAEVAFTSTLMPKKSMTRVAVWWCATAITNPATC